MKTHFDFFEKITNEDLKECFYEVDDRRLKLNKVVVYTQNNEGYCAVYTDGSMDCTGRFSPLQFREIINLRAMVMV